MLLPKLAFAALLVVVTPGLSLAADPPARTAKAAPKVVPDVGGMPEGFDKPYVDQGPDADGAGFGAWRRREMAGGRYGVECPDGPWRPPYGLIVPTNAPCDPTYVGSSFGLNQPSAYGTLPGPGEDAP